MSICRQFPTPSDRMGIIWATLPVKDTVVLEYGPSGTTHYGAETVMDLGIEIDQNLFCTHVDQDDIILGDISRLERAILELDQSRHPRCIFVVGSSLTSVIAADLEGVCRSLQDQVGAKLIPFEHGGFRGDYSLGIADALTAMMEEIAEETTEKQMGTYNILGACHDSDRIGSDVAEIARLLEECFDLKASCVVPYQCSYEDIQNCPKAEFSVVLREEGRKAAEILKKKGNCPYLCGAPYGYQGTLRFVEQIASLTGRTPNPDALAKLQKKVQQAQFRRRRMQFSSLPTEAIVEGNYNLVSGLGDFLQDELGISVVCGICSHSLKQIAEPKEYIRSFPTPQEKEKLDLVKNSRHRLIFGSDPLLSMADDSNVKLPVTFPSFRGFTVATHLPFVGCRGADFLMEPVLRYFNQLTIETMMRG